MTQHLKAFFLAWFLVTLLCLCGAYAYDLVKEIL